MFLYVFINIWYCFFPMLLWAFWWFLYGCTECGFCSFRWPNFCVHEIHCPYTWNWFVLWFEWLLSGLENCFVIYGNVIEQHGQWDKIMLFELCNFVGEWRWWLKCFWKIICLKCNLPFRHIRYFIKNLTSLGKMLL